MYFQYAILSKLYSWCTHGVSMVVLLNIAPLVGTQQNLHVFNRYTSQYGHDCTCKTNRKRIYDALYSISTCYILMICTRLSVNMCTLSKKHKQYCCFNEVTNHQLPLTHLISAIIYVHMSVHTNVALYDDFKIITYNKHYYSVLVCNILL